MKNFYYYFVLVHCECWRLTKSIEEKIKGRRKGQKACITVLVVSCASASHGWLLETHKPGNSREEEQRGNCLFSFTREKSMAEWPQLMGEYRMLQQPWPASFYSKRSTKVRISIGPSSTIKLLALKGLPLTPGLLPSPSTFHPNGAFLSPFAWFADKLISVAFLTCHVPTCSQLTLRLTSFHDFVLSIFNANAVY